MKTSGRLVLLCSDAPKSKVEVDGFTITAHKRARIERTGEQRWHDSIAIDYEGKTNDEIKSWVLFHSFVMYSYETLSSFEGTIEGVIEYEDNPCANLNNYSNVLGQVFFLHKPDNVSVGYEDFYQKFQQADSDIIDAVKNIMISFSPYSYNSPSRIVDSSYWQLLAYYSVVEMIVGQQSYCCQLECDRCHKTPPHYALSGFEWLSRRMNEIVKNEEVAKQYIEYVWAVWQSIRNKTVHSSLHPTAQYVLQEEEYVVYDVKKALGDYEADSTALSALVHSMGDIARYLLLDRLFDLKVFPGISPLQSKRLRF